jgi:FkbH-like protein
VRLADRFGEHGLISVLIALRGAAEPDTLQIDTWLMSCRVINRTVEHFLFNALLDAAARQGIRRLRGTYLATPKNGLVRELYARLGFAPRPGVGVPGDHYELDVEGASPAKTFVRATDLVKSASDG